MVKTNISFSIGIRGLDWPVSRTKLWQMICTSLSEYINDLFSNNSCAASAELTTTTEEPKMSKCMISEPEEKRSESAGETVFNTYRNVLPSLRTRAIHS